MAIETTTANRLITAALKLANVLGVGQTASAEDANDALDALNRMLATWNRQRWLVTQLNTYSFTANGQQVVTVGPTGDVVVPFVPGKIESAYFRQTVPASTPYLVDYQLTLVESWEDYNSITIKALESFPRYAFYVRGNSVGDLRVWPIPSDNLYSVFFTVMAPLQSFATLSDTVEMPDEYQEAILYNLAVRLYATYGLPPNPAVVAIARSSLNTLRRANAQIGSLRMPGSVLRDGTYNPYSDTTR